MAEKTSDPEDVADMLDALARRMRAEEALHVAGSPAAAQVPLAPVIEALDDAPSMGEHDLFTDEEAVTVTVETRNAEAAHVHVSLLKGRLFINVGEGPRAFRRDFPLPAAVDEETAVATFRNGILDVVLPRKR